MALDRKLLQHLQRYLSSGDGGPGKGNRLVEDAERICGRVQRFVAMNLAPPEQDYDALELACHALQLPFRNPKAPTPGKTGQLSLRERAEQAAELLVGVIGELGSPELLERCERILRECHRRQSEMVEARLLSDAVNLDDFGLIGLVLHAMNLSKQNLGILHFAVGFEKREQYGYWDARLKDGFYFEPVRQMARQRLEQAKQMVDLLLRELGEDRAGEKGDQG